MTIRIINTILMLFAVGMGIKQGYSMLSLKPEMVEMFGKWSISQTGIRVNGLITILSAVMILFPKTFLWGNFIMAGTILFIICLQLTIRDIKGAGIEVPFLLINLLIVYLQYPLNQIK